MTTERTCPACGASVGADAAFCGECDSLLSSALAERPQARRTSRPLPPPEPADIVRPPMAPHVPVVPSRTIDCWSCDTPNTPSRMFCVHCGSFIAVGSQVKAEPAAEPFSSPPPVPGDAHADASLPLIAGVAPLGSYSVEAQRRATRRTRTITAVTSLALAMVIGGAALYLASPLSHQPAPESAAVAPATKAPEPDDQTGTVSGITVAPKAESAAAAAVAPDPEPPAMAEPESVSEPVQATEPAQPDEPEVSTDAAPQEEPDVVPAVVEAEPVVEPDPVLAAAPEVVVEPPSDAGEPAVPVDGPSEPSGPAAYDGGWVCRGQISIEDSRVRSWSLGRVSFRPRPGFDRVVLQLERAGNGFGDPVSVTAESMGSWKVEDRVRGAGRPGLGRRSVVLRFDDGFGGVLLRGYRPGGLSTIKEFSIYPAGRDGRNAIISADTDGCFRLRVPAWDDPSASVRRAELHLDIRP